MTRLLDTSVFRMPIYDNLALTKTVKIDKDSIMKLVGDILADFEAQGLIIPPVASLLFVVPSVL